MAENNNDQVGRLPKTPNPKLRALQPLIGQWRVEGPDVSGEVVYEWMEGGFFLIQRYDLVNYGNPFKGIEYAGWDDDTQTVRSRLMGTDGSRFTYTYELDGNTFKYDSGDKDSPIFSKSIDRLATGGPWMVAGRSRRDRKADTTIT